MRILFMGSPDFALPILKVLAEHQEVIAVFTQPDRKAGRGRELTEPPAKILAKTLNLPVYQPKSLKDQEAFELIAKLDPEMIVVAAYGKILPTQILNLPQLGCTNVHASLLPRWRGASPIQAAILEGDITTGVSIMKMDEGLDTGPIYLQHEIPILPDETSGELSSRLADLGASTLVEALPGIESKQLTITNQDDKFATYAPMLKKLDGALDFSKPAERLARQVRAFEPWPSSFFILGDKRIVVRKANAVDGPTKVSGSCFRYNQYPAISANPGILILEKVQPAGKKVMPANEWLRGAKDFLDVRITNSAQSST
jgi:methionyl-tRNA formyltransferase